MPASLRRAGLLAILVGRERRTPGALRQHRPPDLHLRTPSIRPEPRILSLEFRAPVILLEPRTRGRSGRLATIRIVTSRPDSSCAPHTSGFSSISLRQPRSRYRLPAACSISAPDPGQVLLVGHRVVDDRPG